MKRRLFIALLAAALLGCDTTNTDEPELKNDPIVATGACGFGWIKDADSQKAPQYASIRQIAAVDVPPTLDLRVLFGGVWYLPDTAGYGCVWWWWWWGG